MVWDAPAMANAAFERGLAALRGFSKRGRERLVMALAVLLLAVVYGPTLAEHIRNASDPFRFADDARILIPPLFRAGDPALFPGDPVTDYYLAGLPDAPRLLYSLFAPLVDPATLSKILPYVLLLRRARLPRRDDPSPGRQPGHVRRARTRARLRARPRPDGRGASSCLRFTAALRGRALSRSRATARSRGARRDRRRVLSGSGRPAWPVAPRVVPLAGERSGTRRALLARPSGGRARADGRRDGARRGAVGAPASRVRTRPSTQRLRRAFRKPANSGVSTPPDRPPFPALPRGGRRAAHGGARRRRCAPRRSDESASARYRGRSHRLSASRRAASSCSRDGGATPAVSPFSAPQSSSPTRLSLVLTPRLFLPERYVAYGMPVLALVGVPAAFSFLCEHTRTSVRSVPLVWNLARARPRRSAWRVVVRAHRARPVVRASALRKARRASENQRRRRLARLRDRQRAVPFAPQPRS